VGRHGAETISNWAVDVTTRRLSAIPLMLRTASDWRIERVGCVTSTQDVARTRAPVIGPGGRLAVLAEEQTDGRGRHGRVWLSPRGGMYASLLLVPSPLLFARVGVAVARAVHACGVDCRLKWPNDVLVGGRKLAGILIEVAEGVAVAGIGVNIHVAPHGHATCLAEEVATPLAADVLLERILHELTALDDARVLDAYRSECATLGRRVRVGIGDRQDAVLGEALDVDETGRLVVRSSEGERVVVSAGDCIHLEGAQGGG